MSEPVEKSLGCSGKSTVPGSVHLGWNMKDPCFKILNIPENLVRRADDLYDHEDFSVYLNEFKEQYNEVYEKFVEAGIVAPLGTGFKDFSSLNAFFANHKDVHDDDVVYNDFGGNDDFGGDDDDDGKDRFDVVWEPGPDTAFRSHETVQRQRLVSLLSDDDEDGKDGSDVTLGSDTAFRSHKTVQRQHPVSPLPDDDEDGKDGKDGSDVALGSTTALRYHKTIKRQHSVSPLPGRKMQKVQVLVPEEEEHCGQSGNIFKGS